MAKSKAQPTIIKPEKQLSGILTVSEIKSHGLIMLADNDSYSNASYDFRLGDEYYIPNQGHEFNTLNTVPYINCPHKIDEESKRVLKCSDDNHVLRIKPFTSVVISTYEWLKMPDFVAGRFDLRIKWALQGLILQVGTQIEPGYQGRLFGLVHNFSKKEICIPTKSRFLTVEFSYTSVIAPPIIRGVERTEPFNSLKDFLTKFPAIDGTLENYLEKIKSININFHEEWSKKFEESNIIINKALANLNEQKSEVEKLLNKNIETSRFKENLRVVFWGILITIFISIPLTIGVPLFVTKFTVDKDDYPFQKVYEMEQQNIELKKQVLKLNESLLNLDLKLDSIKKSEKPIGKGGQK